MKDQIEEVKTLLCEAIDGKCNGYCGNCNCLKQSQALYNAGYRKQSEGEWKRSKKSKYDYFCTVCGEKAIQNIYGNYDRLFKHCPNCGAKMKGGAE